METSTKFRDGEQIRILSGAVDADEGFTCGGEGYVRRHYSYDPDVLEVWGPNAWFKDYAGKAQYLSGSGWMRVKSEFLVSREIRAIPDSRRHKETHDPRHPDEVFMDMRLALTEEDTEEVAALAYEFVESMSAHQMVLYQP